MKMIHWFFIFIVLSSCKGSYIRDVEDFQGEWEIHSITYFDGNQYIYNAGSIGNINFGKEKPNSTEGVNLGKQSIGNWNGAFQYSFSFSIHKIDISHFGIDRKLFPKDAIGRVQVYNYEAIDNNTLRIYTDKEFDYASNTLRKEISYLLKR